MVLFVSQFVLLMPRSVLSISRLLAFPSVPLWISHVIRYNIELCIDASPLDIYF